MNFVDYLNNLFLGYLPYIALAAFTIGVIYHLIIADKNVHATSTMFLKKDRLMLWGSPMFHFGIILVFFGHVFGLLTPPALIEVFMPLATKRLIAITMGAGAGLIALGGIFLLILRRFFDIRIRRTGSFQDYFIILLIALQICLGLLSTFYTSRSTLANYLTFDFWAQGLVWFEPDAWRYIATADIIYKLHIINGFFIFIIFPYTKLMHMVKVPVLYMFRANKVYK